MKLAHITDTHLLAEPAALYNGVDTHAALAALLPTLVSDAWRPDLIVLTGDLADDGQPGTYARIRVLLESIGLPVYCVPGNHDDRGAMRAAFSGEGRVKWERVVRMGAWQIVMLDSLVPGENRGHLEPVELAALENALAAAPDLHTIVALHHGPGPVCPMPGCRLDNAEDFFAVAARHSNLRATISGHLHCADDRGYRGTRHLVTPSTCFQATHPVGEPVAMDLPFLEKHSIDSSRRGWRRLELQEDGAIETELVWM